MKITLDEIIKLLSNDPLNHVGDDKETKLTFHKPCSNRSPTYDASKQFPTQGFSEVS